MTAEILKETTTLLKLRLVTQGLASRKPLKSETAMLNNTLGDSSSSAAAATAAAFPIEVEAEKERTPASSRTATTPTAAAAAMTATTRTAMTLIPRP